MLTPKHLCTLACYALMCATTTHAQELPLWLVPTPPAPATLLPWMGNVHVLTSQVDADFNGVQDEGDVPAQWIAVDATTRERVMARTLPWGSNYVNRSAMAAGSLFTHHGDTLVQYDIATGDVRTVAVTGAVSVAVNTNAAFAAAAVRPSFTDPGKVLLIDISSGEIKGEYPVGINPGALYIEFGANAMNKDIFRIVVVCEGLFGQPSSQLNIVTIDASDYTATEQIVELGDTGNGLFVIDQSQRPQEEHIAFITMNGSHSVVAVDLNEGKVVGTLNVGTTGYDGPRELAYRDDGHTFVSTFASDVREFNYEGDRVATYLPGGKPEGLLIVNDQLWVTRTFVEGGFAADSGVAVFDLDDMPTSVHEEQRPLQTSVWPLPATTHVNVRGVGQHAAIISATGMQYSVPVVVTADGVARFRVEALPNGVYAVRDGSVVHRFVVQR